MQPLKSYLQADNCNFLSKYIDVIESSIGSSVYYTHITLIYIYGRKINIHMYTPYIGNYEDVKTKKNEKWKNDGLYTKISSVH